jgi:hypothetical protein
VNADFVFPAFTAGAFAIVGAVALVASPLGKARTARDEAAETAQHAAFAQQVRTGRDEAARTPDPAGCASACAQILHDHLAATGADFSAVSFAAHLYAYLGPTSMRDHTDPLWLAIPFNIDTPPATIAACLAAAASRHRDNLYAADQKRAGLRINTAIGYLDEHLTGAIDGGDHVRALIRQLDRAFDTRWTRVPGYVQGGTS